MERATLGTSKMENCMALASISGMKARVTEVSSNREREVGRGCSAIQTVLPILDSLSTTTTTAKVAISGRRDTSMSAISKTITGVGQVR